MNGRSICRQGQGAFTLLELLVVIAILAIIAGGLLVAYDQLDDKASEGVAAHSQAALDGAVRAYTTVERHAPDRLDALVAADPANVATTGAKVAILPDKLLGGSSPKTLLMNLTAAQVTALANAGIRRLRYVDAKGNDPASPAPGSGDRITLDVPNADGSPASVGPLLDIDIPHRIHETPRPGTNNRGRGFEHTLAAGDPVHQWNADRSGGGGGYDNTKLGAGPDDVLVVFGLGNDATIVGSQAGRTQLPSAPVFGKTMQRYEYGRYLLLYNLGPAGAPRATAVFQCVLNTHGDFVDEMISEHLGQKP